MVKFLILCCIACVMNNSRATEELDQRQFELNTSPIVVKSLGVLLKPIGFLASGGDSTYMSLFLDVPTPHLTKYDCREDNTSQCLVTPEWVKTSWTNFEYLTQRNVTLFRTTDLKQVSSEDMANCLSLCAREKCNRLAYNNELKLCRLNHNYEKLKQNALYKAALRKGDKAILSDNWTLVDINDHLLRALSDHCAENFLEPELSKIFRETSERDIQALWNKSHETYATLVKAYQLVDNGTSRSEPVFLDRNKRSKALLTAVAALPLVGLGVTFWESLQVRNYVKRLESQFNEFVAESSAIHKQQLQFNKNVIKLYQEITDNQKILSCNLDIVAYQVLKERQVAEWKSLTNTILSGVLSNKLTMPVHPQIMPYKYLKNVTKSELFKDSIYEEKPESIYTLGKLTLVGFKNLESSWRYHFVLIVPTIKPESVYNRYKVEQVGKQVNNSCIQFKLPDQVYQIKDKFYQVMDDNCYERDNALKICLKPTSEKAIDEHISASCLNKETECTVEPVACNDKTCFSTAGVLVFSEKTILGIANNLGGSLVFDEISIPEETTSFYSWKNYSHIMIGNRLIQSLKKPVFHLEFEPIPLMNWTEFLQKTTSHAIKTNYSALIEIVNNQEEQLLTLQKKSSKDSESNLNSKTMTILTYSGIALWVLTITALISWRIAFRIKTYKKRLSKETKVETQSQPPPPPVPMQAPYPPYPSYPIGCVPSAPILETYPMTSSGTLHRSSKKSKGKGKKLYPNLHHQEDHSLYETMTRKVDQDEENRAAKKPKPDPIPEETPSTSGINYTLDMNRLEELAKKPL